MEITKTRFQLICEASKEDVSAVIVAQMHGITMHELCSNPARYISIAGLAKDSNERTRLMRIIQIMLGELVSAVNVKNNLKVSQLPVLASHIVTEYSFMSLEAIYLCFKNIITNPSEDVWKLDMPFICKKLREFDDEWYAYFSRIRDSKHGQDKGSMKTQFTDAAVTLYRKHERG